MARKVVSRSFTISALWDEETGTTRSKTGSKAATASSVHSGVSPPTTLGTSRMTEPLPGSRRSGAKAREKSTPTLSPVASRSGRKSSWVVPG